MYFLVINAVSVSKLILLYTRNMSSVNLATRFLNGNVSVEQGSFTNAFPRSTESDIIQHFPLVDPKTGPTPPPPP